jgi:ABC-2 type transport system ATP-binding protein
VPSPEWTAAGAAAPARAVDLLARHVLASAAEPLESSTMIEAIGLAKSYGTVAALRGVSFAVQPGEILGYLGPNGAGKSTTVKILTGLLPADAGQARIGGHDVASDPVAAKRLVGLVPESGALYEALTPLEYLRFVGRLYELSRAQAEARAGELLELLQLEPAAWHRRLCGLSKGMKQRVVIAAALLHRPRVLLLDEPLNGLDVGATIQFKALIAREAAAGCTILYSSHLLDVVERVCTRLIVLAQGSIRFDGSLAEVQRRHPGKTLEAAFQELAGLGAEPRDPDPAESEAR